MILLVVCVVVITYLIIIGSYSYGFDKVSEFYMSDDTSKTKFTVIIPFRDEAENLLGLTQSLKALEYRKTHFEVIFVDDDSSDDSANIISAHLSKNDLPFKIINREIISKSPKKDALSTALKQAKNEWIITTDADCILPKYWLNSFDSFIQNSNYKCIAGPVCYTPENTFLHKFQTLDFLSLMGSTIGSFGLKLPYMANGANLCYKHDFFKTLNGFEGNSHIASGDDVFLLQKAIKANKEAVGFIKSKQAIVSTKPLNTLHSLTLQRLRWASKSTAYTSIFAKLSALSVFSMNLLVILALGLLISQHITASTCFYIWILKIGIDFLLIFKTAHFFNQEYMLKPFFWSSLLYPFFVVYIAFTSFFKGYTWKNRSFTK